MRKLTAACPASCTHHALAALAITEAGVTKKPLLIEGFRREIDQLDYLERTHAGAYRLGLVAPDGILRVKTYTGECVVRWRFNYPDLRLITMHIDRCAHLGIQQRRATDV